MTQLDTLLQSEGDRLDDERRTLQENIAEAEKRLREIHTRIAHVEGLLGTSDAAERRETNSGERSLTDIAEEILGERDREPMHYKDLAREVQSRGGSLSGGNAANILVARLVSDDRFIRPLRKGFYALRRDYPGAKNVGARKRRRSSE